MTTDSPRRLSLPFVSLIGGVSLIALLLTVSVSGCGSKDNEQGPAPNDIINNSDAEPEIPVDSILDNLQPAAFGMTVPRTLPRADLDEWADSMLADMIDADIDEKELAAQLGEHLDAEQVDRILRRQFVLQDCAHVRDMLWAKGLLQTIHVPGQNAGDLERAVAAFYHVVHTIALNGDQPSLPLGPFESMLYGRGTAADRAWAFALLLQQRRVPVVVLNVPDVDSDDALLVGVIIESEAYLFDATRGLPVAGADDNAEDGLIRKVATLNQVVADGSLLKKLDSGDLAYPITSDQLQQAELQIIGDTSLWSRRMEGLNNALSGAANVYLPLVGETGMLARVSQSLGESVAADRVSIWNYPDHQRQARESLSEDERARLDEWKSPLQVPYLIRVKQKPETGEPVVMAESAGRQTHRQARIDQVLGQPQRAIPRYLKIQTWREVPPTPRDHPVIEQTPDNIQIINAALPAQVRDDHAFAAEQARFWRAASQFQQGNWTAASRDLEAYITACNQGKTVQGVFRGQAAYLCGIAHAQQQNWGYARSYMRLVPAESPAHVAAKLLANRWDALADR